MQAHSHKCERLIPTYSNGFLFWESEVGSFMSLKTSEGN